MGLTENIAAWRASNQTHQGLLSKIQIGSALYDIKDPAVEALATGIEARLATLEGHEWTAVTKTSDAKFATSVTQDTTGAITVEYSNFTGLTDAAVDGQFVSSVSQGTDGEITVTRTGISADKVAFSETGWNATGVQAAVLEALSKAVGTNEDGTSAETIYGAKAYAKDLVDTLAGEDWENNAKKVQEIIEELENSDNANAWATAIDKLAGLNITYTQAEADEHNAGLTGAISTSTVLTAEQASALNAIGGASSHAYEAGQSPTAEDAALYNATLTGAYTTSTVKTPQTVKQYVDAKVAAAESAASGGITDLDMIVYGADGATGSTGSTATSDYADDTTHKVAIKLTEVDGKVTAIDVKTNDIASATGVAAAIAELSDEAVKSVNGATGNAVTIYATDITLSNGSATSVSGALTSLDENKANKAAITGAQVNNWACEYAATGASAETLIWTNTATDVYVPVSGQTL